jgi:hypothetical protein
VGLQELGWSVGRNVRIDYRWGANNLDPDRMRKDAADLLALAPDVVLATTAPIVVALQQVSRVVPIAFTTIIDPVGAGLVASLARPGGNATGFAMFEYGISAKWLELLKEISPSVKRVAVLREPTLAGIGQLAAMQTAAPSFGMELQPIDVSAAGEIERALTNFAHAPKRRPDRAVEHVFDCSPCANCRSCGSAPSASNLSTQEAWLVWRLADEGGPQFHGVLRSETAADADAQALGAKGGTPWQVTSIRLPCNLMKSVARCCRPWGFWPRRRLNESQRAMCAARLATMKEARPTKTSVLINCDCPTIAG